MAWETRSGRRYFYPNACKAGLVLAKFAPASLTTDESPKSCGDPQRAVESEP